MAAQTSFWLDPRLHGGSLVEQFGNRPIYDLHLSRDLKVSHFIARGKWDLPQAALNQLIDIFQLIAGAPHMEAFRTGNLKH